MCLPDPSTTGSLYGMRSQHDDRGRSAVLAVETPLVCPTFATLNGRYPHGREMPPISAPAKPTCMTGVPASVAPSFYAATGALKRCLQQCAHRG